MRFRVLDAADAGDVATWLAIWSAWPAKEVVTRPEYAQLFARPGDRAVCVVGEDEGGAILFPLILRPLALEPWARRGELRRDAITPYGYGGPFVCGGGVRDQAAFWAAYGEWCRDERIVTTFARLSLFAEQLAPMPGRVEVRSQNVVVRLDGGSEGLWRNYESKVRKWVRLAEAAGVTVEVDRDGSGLDAFFEVYTHTMQRRRADEFYFFPRSFFESIVTRLGGRFVFFHARAGGKVVSSDLVLCADEHVYYFLGGTLEEAFALGPSYLVKHRIAEWSMGEGKRRYVLGGGHEPDDGLYRYKRAFDRRGAVPFRVAALVHDEVACRELADARAAHASREGKPWRPRTGFFPAYRA
ncbi:MULTISPECIES: GNAT family N-acetyltransferase [unclassified Anaeromyxobacter]|uniref:lipid II:glycine glycyltransferase FemX n=1 Tax=unclassified Anaeromyxobacter TaxID=2620896 RepID=UPI001F565A4B|nr:MULTISPECIES: GNAT family N-acetyltransferase [unclassified Anaeromyxobacter]